MPPGDRGTRKGKHGNIYVRMVDSIRNLPSRRVHRRINRRRRTIKIIAPRKGGTKERI